MNLPQSRGQERRARPSVVIKMRLDRVFIANLNERLEFPRDHVSPDKRPAGH
jgi:hypothetical protein